MKINEIVLAGNQTVCESLLVSQPQNKMTATTSALYDAANAAYDKTQAAQAEAFRAAVYGDRDEAAKALASFLAAKAIEFDLTRKADAAADAAAA